MRKRILRVIITSKKSFAHSYYLQKCLRIITISKKVCAQLPLAKKFLRVVITSKSFLRLVTTSKNFFAPGYSQQKNLAGSYYQQKLFAPSYHKQIFFLRLIIASKKNFACSYHQQKNFLRVVNTSKNLLQCIIISKINLEFSKMAEARNFIGCIQDLLGVFACGEFILFHVLFVQNEENLRMVKNSFFFASVSFPLSLVLHLLLY